MNTLFRFVRKFTRAVTLGRMLGAASLAAAAVPVFAATTIGLSSQPLNTVRAPHPNVLVALSVEWPTVGRAYLKDQKGAFVPYNPAQRYVGYFDSSKCYKYSASSPAQSTIRTPAIVQGSSEYFYPVSAIQSGSNCSGNAFNGNYMNWVSMSAIDELRLSLTGGNRIVDLGPGGSPSTVLLRAFLPDGSIAGVGGAGTGFFTTGTSSINWPLSVTSASASSGLYAPVAPSTVTPFSDKTVYTTGCRNLIFFSTSTSGTSCDSPAADKGIYRVAVQVCDATEGPARRDLCQLYTSAAGLVYKPVGEVQKNVDRMRFSVFSYLMDNSTNNAAIPSGCNDSGWNRCRFGGVLRSKMKYLGSQAYDSSLKASPNVNQEINDDGTFRVDPDKNAILLGGYSGFINYVNRFGATGVYKRHDPAGEMFYEALRYFENRQGSPAATSGMTTGMQDGFPVVAFGPGNAEDPMLNRCQANYIINVSDGNTNDDMYLPGWTGTPSDPYRPAPKPATSGFMTSPDDAGFDAFAWTGKVGTFEGIPDLASRSIGCCSGSFFIAGAALWANTNDIRSADAYPGKQTVKTISFDVGEIMSSPYDDVTRRQLYYAGKYGGFNDLNNDGSPFTTVDASGQTVTNNSEWEDALGSGFPTNYILASDPGKLINGFSKAFAGINKPLGTSSGLALSSTKIVLGGAGAFTVTFNPYKWSGSVALRSLTSQLATVGVVSSAQLVVSTVPTWDAATQLDAAIGTNPSTVPTNAAARNVFTMNSANTGIAFDWASVNSDKSALISGTGATYADYLNTDPQTGNGDALGQKRLNFLRGDRVTDESPNGAQFRSRTSAFGDVVNSSPLYVGKPSLTIADADYPAFFKTYRDRTPAVYVGANDGMLHAIDATTGNELFTYVPRAIANKLNRLTNPAYTHTAYVDAPPEAAEAKLGTTWKTVLVSGLGSGAQGVFALDVSNPSTFGTSVGSKVLWEFTDADDADFGNVVGKPLIVKINTAAANATVPDYKWFAIVTGYNSLQTKTPDGATDNFVGSDQRGAIFLLRLDKSAGTKWILGTNYYKIMTPYDTTVADTTKPNGLSPVTYLPNRNGRGDAVSLYTGDLQGNLWKIDLTQTPTSWTGTSAVKFSAKPLFTAKDASGNRQPITARPTLARGPLGGTLVLFGTGQYLGAADLSTVSQQSFYTIFDDGGDLASTQVSQGSGGRSDDLVARQLTVNGGVVTTTGSAFVFASGATPPAGAKKGWYFDFLNSDTTGERSVSSAVVDSGIATFSTVTLSGDPCGSGGGFIYQLSATTGLGFDAITDLLTNVVSSTIGAISNVGIPGPAQSVQLASMTPISQSTGELVSQKGYGAVVSGTSGDIKLNDKKSVIRLVRGRINWREISNWNDIGKR